MSRLSCPFCGVRELHEFQFRKTLPEPGGSSYSDVYERTNRVGVSIEHWQHVLGCRAWLLVRRDPSSDEVVEMQLLGCAAQ